MRVSWVAAPLGWTHFGWWVFECLRRPCNSCAPTLIPLPQACLAACILLAMAMQASAALLQLSSPPSQGEGRICYTRVVLHSFLLHSCHACVALRLPVMTVLALPCLHTCSTRGSQPAAAADKAGQCCVVCGAGRDPGFLPAWCIRVRRQPAWQQARLWSHRPGGRGCS